MMIKTLDNVYINMEDFSGFTIGYPNDSDFTVMAMKELVDNQTATIELGRDSNNPEENFGLSNRYVKFLKKNTIKYYDRLCGFERQQYLSGYGFMQGYFDIDKVLDLLKKEGSVKVPFSWLYDIRQYDKCMDGCYMEITKIA